MTKTFGTDHTTHHLLEIREPPPSIVVLRNLLHLPANEDILRASMQAGTFEEAMATIAMWLGIVIDGVYDAAILADVLATALSKRKLGSELRPHILDPRLSSAEILESRSGKLKIRKI